MSDSMCERSVTTPSVSTGTQSGYVMRRMVSPRSYPGNGFCVSGVMLLVEPDRMCRVHAEDRDVGGEERELLERERERSVVGMRFDVGEELRREEQPADHVALQLGHVDTVGGESAERLVQRGRNVAYVENERRDGRTVALRYGAGLTAEDDEAGRVVRLVLDARTQRPETVELPCE